MMISKRRKKEEKKEKPVDAKRAADLDILLAFDINYNYGPCTGQLRIERYQRAISLGLKVDPRIGEILASYDKNDEEIQCHRFIDRL